MSIIRTRAFVATAIFAGLVAALMMLCAPSQALAAQESEPNDSFATADITRLGDKAYGTVRGMYFLGKIPKDEDFYSIYIPESGSYKISLANYNYQDKYASIYLTAYNPYYDELCNVYANTQSTKPEYEEQYLQKGMNYVKISGGIPEVDTPYRFWISPVVSKTSITKVTAGKKSATVKYKKIYGSSKYEIRYAKNKKMSGAKKVTVKASKSSAKIKKLQKNKKYYFQVRVVKKLDGKNFYSNWSAKKSVKIRR